MKTTKGVDFAINVQGTPYQSYRKGWSTAIRNFDKGHVRVTPKDLLFFPLHSN